MTRARHIALLCTGLSSAQPAAAQEHVLLIGGGFRPEGSQVQIELNVRWIQEVLAAKKPGVQVETYFAAGDRPEVRDVVESRAPTETGSVTAPLARLFGVYNRNSEVYFHSRVEHLSGGTDAALLVSRLTQLFKGASAKDQILFIYNGHGSGDAENTAKNALRLWRDERLSVEELGALLDLLPPTARVRMFFPQCFAGGFARLIHPGTRRTRAVVEGDRCGFFAQDELLESEGCTPSVEVDDYRDYSTYFFSALVGQTRSGKPLAFEPDRNRDGKVTLREAHFFSMIAADSADLPFSTSEAFLERWQPWHARWSGSRGSVKNVYAELAEELAKKLTQKGGTEAFHAALAAREQAEQSRGRIATQRSTLKLEINALSEALRAAAEERWPGAFRPHTQSFADFYQHELAAASRFVAGEPRYPELAAKQDEDRRLELEDLAERRRAANLDRYFRLRRLAQLWELFDRTADDSARATLARLVACEDSAL